MSMTIADLDDWESVHELYDPEPYRKAFQLECMVQGQCCLFDLDGGCYVMTHRAGTCRYLFECWPTAVYCGPAFVKKYKIPKRGGNDT